MAIGWTHYDTSVGNILSYKGVKLANLDYATKVGERTREDM